MRATVGPLSPAVYWRRRAVVLGAVLLGIIVWFVSCSGGDDPDPKKNASQTSSFPTPGTENPSAAASPTPSFEEKPSGEQLFPDPVQQSPDETLPPPANASAPVVDPGTVAGAGATCTDEEITVTPIPSDTSPQRGVPTKIQLKIKNISSRSCTRDLGASAQELYIEQGTQRIWSSDACATIKGNQIENLGAGAERLYEVTWNGRQSNQCSADAPSGAFPQPGAYQLRGRLDSRVSEPAVILTIVA